MNQILIILFCIQIATIRSDCNYKQYIDGRTLVLQRNRTDYLISRKQRNYNIPEDGSVELFCASGFKSNYYNSDSPFGSMMTVYCDNDGTYYSIGTYKRERLSEYQHFTCPLFTLSFYSKKFDYCDYEGFYYGMEIDEIPIVFAEFCYNYNNSEIISVHYVAGKRNTLLSAQRQYNPNDSSWFYYKFDIATIISPSNKEYPSRIELENNFTLFNPSLRLLLKEIHYEFHELIPSDLYSGYFHDFIGDMKSTNAITWWMPLKKGNWEIFQRLLAKETSKRSFEIYAGQSGVARYPQEFVCNSINELAYEFNGEQKNVPFYIWNYIISRNEYERKEFVLIAINSPFTETIANNSFVLCDDMCDQVDWLRPLASTRHIVGFGYIFCCDPDDVKHELNGFPLPKGEFGVIDYDYVY